MTGKLELAWYQHDDVVFIAKQLLGKLLCTKIDGVVTKGKIVETEAYSGNNDKACHANNQRKTRRNEIMFSAGGHAYIYLCYGIHHLMNVVTNKAGCADAVLIRAIEPVEGLEFMMQRRKLDRIEKRLSGGPGLLSSAMGITINLYGETLTGNTIWIEDQTPVENTQIESTTRIGVEYAGEDAKKPWRFYIKENPWVSRS